MKCSRYSTSGCVWAVAAIVAASIIWLWSTIGQAGAWEEATTAKRQPRRSFVAAADETLAPPSGTALTSPYGDIGVTWSTNAPVTTEVTSGVRYEWVITQYGVTITFRENSITDDAVFTFAPRDNLSLDPPQTSAPYFFDLTGVYKLFGNQVSLWHAIDITLEYNESELGDIKEGTLDAFHKDGDKWVSEEATVDIKANHLTWSTEWLGTFGVGGFAHVVFLPLVSTE